MRSNMISDEELFKEIGESVEQLNNKVLSWKTQRKQLKQKHVGEIYDLEHDMLEFLFRCKGLLSTSKLATMIGMSRQSLYNKWRQHGFKFE